MVAIAVVGGILIFVFAQGFFTDTNIGTPTIESIEIFGYDASDKAILRTHIHDPTATTQNAASGFPTISAAASSNLKDDDAITVFIRNKGASAVTIERIKVYGSDYLWNVVATSGALGTTTPAVATATERFFALSRDGQNTSTAPTIEPGQEATLIIRYDEATNGKIKIGRPIPVVIQTGSGAVFTKQLQNGVAVG
jgi:hypothetical protein